MEALACASLEVSGCVLHIMHMPVMITLAYRRCERLGRVLDITQEEEDCGKEPGK